MCVLASGSTRKTVETGFGRSFHDDAGGEASGVDLLLAWGEDEMGARFLELGEVGGFVARITREILVGRELPGIDEDRGDHPVGMRETRRHQCNVPAMQSAHGRHDRAGQAFAPPFCGLRPQIRDITDDFQGHFRFVREMLTEKAPVQSRPRS